MRQIAPFTITHLHAGLTHDKNIYRTSVHMAAHYKNQNVNTVHRDNTIRPLDQAPQWQNAIPAPPALSTLDRPDQPRSA